MKSTMNDMESGLSTVVCRFTTSSDHVNTLKAEVAELRDECDVLHLTVQHQNTGGARDDWIELYDIGFEAAT